MSEMTPQSQSAVPEGYIRKTIPVDGVDMSFTFYEGFASSVSYTPRGGRPIPVYQQEGVFHVPGGGAPASQCTMWITGGPDNLNVELEINDGPRTPPDYKGPIESFEVVTRPNGGGASNPRVRPIKGGNQVAAIHVQMKGESGGVRPHMPEGGGSTTVTNDSKTCPPICG